MKRLLRAIEIYFCEMIYGSDRCLALSLLTDYPEKDDNGENDVAQEAIKRVHAGLTAVMLAEKLGPILRDTLAK